MHHPDPPYRVPTKITNICTSPYILRYIELSIQAYFFSKSTYDRIGEGLGEGESLPGRGIEGDHGVRSGSSGRPNGLQQAAAPQTLVVAAAVLFFTVGKEKRGRERERERRMRLFFSSSRPKR
jgi:hypothetical protein